MSITELVYIARIICEAIDKNRLFCSVPIEFAKLVQCDNSLHSVTNYYVVLTTEAKDELVRVVSKLHGEN